MDLITAGTACLRVPMVSMGIFLVLSHTLPPNWNRPPCLHAFLRSCLHESDQRGGRHMLLHCAGNWDFDYPHVGIGLADLRSHSPVG